MSNIDDFLRRFSDYLAKANESKKRGNNDYNPLKAVQKPYDEVNMHSGFIYSLLDTNGEHYQDDLFLSLFLEVLGIKEWFGSTTNAQVRKESQNIDLYIFNDTKHIIIENKINAGDQPNQIAIFIEQVHKKGVEYENIFVIFLTLHDREPSQNSRTSKDNNLWEIKGDFLESKEGKIGYKKVLYENEILKWIESCQSKSGVGNIANLNYALESYKDIVQIITNKKKSTMSVADFFKDSKDFEVAFEIIKNADSFKDSKDFEIAFEIIKNAEIILELAKKEMHELFDNENFKDWEINADKIILEFVKKEMYELFNNKEFKDWKIENKENYLEVFNTLYEQQFFKYKFVLGILGGDYRSYRLLGATLYKNNDIIKYNDNIPKEIIEHQDTDSRNTLKGRWLKGWVSNDYNKIKNFKDYFLKNYEKVNEINEWLREQKFNNTDL